MSTLKQRAAWSKHAEEQEAKARKKVKKSKKKMTPISRKGKNKFSY